MAFTNRLACHTKAPCRFSESHIRGPTRDRKAIGDQGGVQQYANDPELHRVPGDTVGFPSIRARRVVLIPRVQARAHFAEAQPQLFHRRRVVTNASLLA